MYTLLLAEALQDIPASAHLFIVPDGILGLLPFEALVIAPGQDENTTRFVGETLQPRYYQSAAVLTLLRALGPSQAPRTLFALGDPIYDRRDPRYTAQQQGGPPPPLPPPPATQRPCLPRAIHPPFAGARDTQRLPLQHPGLSPSPRDRHRGQKHRSALGAPPQPPGVLLQARANESQLRQTPLSRYRYLHFATHADLPGKLQGINEPFLLLGRVENREKDDGLLTFSAVLNLHLDAEMVVLSACMTGRGVVLEGEGVANFARAFHQAGARSVVVSLWEVASNVTEEYMKHLYRHLKSGQGKAAALALAHQEIKALYPHPFFWAPFIVHGEGSGAAHPTRTPAQAAPNSPSAALSERA